MAAKTLTDTVLRALKAKAAAYKVSDGGGLHILVAVNGSKTWRLAYRADGKQRCLTIGPYPKVSLLLARKARESAKDKLRAGIDPALPEAATSSEGPTFAQAARGWHASQEKRWTPAYAKQVITRIEADLIPDFENTPIATVTRSQLLATLRKVEERGTIETARRLKQYAGAIFRYAGATDDRVNDPTPMLRGALVAPPRSRHHAALKRADIGAFIRTVETYDGEKTTALAIQLALHTAVRTGELIRAQWHEFESVNDPANALWRIPAERMKMRREHLVPMSPQSLILLEQLREITGGGNYILPAADARPGHMSNNTMLFAAYRMGYRGRMTIHGFRRTFSTEANEHGWPADHIELQLAHDDQDTSRAAYNAAQYLAGRRAIMNWWSARLVDLRDGRAQKAA